MDIMGSWVLGLEAVVQGHAIPGCLRRMFDGANYLLLAIGGGCFISLLASKAIKTAHGIGQKVYVLRFGGSVYKVNRVRQNMQVIV